jgi:hypothetical protein
MRLFDCCILAFWHVLRLLRLHKLYSTTPHPGVRVCCCCGLIVRCLFFFCRTMTAICFVCNLPILSHQVGLVWQGGNGWDDLMREQVEESTLRQRLGRRDSAAQITSISPPTETRETSPPACRRRRLDYLITKLLCKKKSQDKNLYVLVASF